MRNVITPMLLFFFEPRLPRLSFFLFLLMPRVTMWLVHVAPRVDMLLVLSAYSDVTSSPHVTCLLTPDWSYWLTWQTRHLPCDADSSAFAHVAEAYWTAWLELLNQLVPCVPLMCEWSLCSTRRQWHVQATRRLPSGFSRPNFFRWEIFGCLRLIGKIKTYKFPFLNSDINFFHIKLKNKTCICTIGQKNIDFHKLQCIKQWTKIIFFNLFSII